MERFISILNPDKLKYADGAMEPTSLQPDFWNSFWPSFAANLVAGALLLGLTIVIVNLWIARRDTAKLRLIQQQTEERTRITLILDHLALLDKEIEVFEGKLPEVRNVVAEYEWGRLVFIHTTAWDTVRQNTVVVSMLSLGLISSLMDFYHYIHDAERCIDLLVKSWFVDPKIVPSFEAKQKALHGRAIESLDLASFQSSNLRWAIADEIKKINLQLQESNARQSPT